MIKVCWSRQQLQTFPFIFSGTKCPAHYIIKDNKKFKPFKKIYAVCMQVLSRSSKQETMKVFRHVELRKCHVVTYRPTRHFSPAGAHGLLSPGMKLGTTFPEYSHLPPVELTLTVRTQPASSKSAGSLAKV